MPPPPLSSPLPPVRRLLLQPQPPSPFLAWSLAFGAGEYGLVRGDQHYRPRRLVSDDDNGEGLLLLSLQSKGGRVGLLSFGGGWMDG